MHILAWLSLLPVILTVAQAQPVTPQAEGGPAAARLEGIGRDAGPANHPPRNDGSQAIHRGSDVSAVGLEAPSATGTTPQGMLGDATAGARRAPAPVGSTPEPQQSAPPPH